MPAKRAHSLGFYLQPHESCESYPVLFTEQAEARDRMVVYKGQCDLSIKAVCSQHEAVPTEPLDALYEALAEVLMAKESTQCHRSYLLV